MSAVYVEYLGNSLELPFGETSVGRDVACALRFNDPSVSRKHFRLIRRHDEVFVEDLGSSNGTLLNGRKVAAALKVEDRDTIVFGSRELMVRITEGELDDNSTLLLTGLKSAEPPKEQPFTRLLQGPQAGLEMKNMRATTAQIAVVRPPPLLAHQRCPNCAAPVSEIDDECQNCHYNWGSFRPMSRTDVRPTMISRRRHERQPIELRLLYVSSELEIEAMTRDLSESGVFVCSQVLDPIGTTTQLTILLDGGPPLAIRGVVRRVVERSEAGSEPTGLGVQFLDVGPTELAWIRSVIAQMSDADD